MSVTICKNNIYSDSVIVCFEYNDVIFKAHTFGTYPDVINDKGESIRDIPHITLYLQTEQETDEIYMSIIACGTFVNGRQNTGTYKKVLLTDSSPAAILNAIEDHKDSAVAFLQTLDASLSEIQKLDCDLYNTTRKEYEALCCKYSVIPFDDSQITLAFVNGLSKEYQESTVSEVILNKLTKYRLNGLENEGILANPCNIFKKSPNSYYDKLETPPSDTVLFVFQWFGSAPTDIDAVKQAPNFVKNAKTNWGKDCIHYDEGSQAIKFICDGNYGSAVVAPIEKLPELVQWLDTYFIKNNGIRDGANWRINQGAYSRHVFSFEALNLEQVEKHSAYVKIWKTFDSYLTSNDSYLN